MKQLITSGYKKLDALTNGGFRFSDLVVVAGNPQAGKTAFILGIAGHAALKERKPAAIFSFHDPKEELTRKLISSNSCVNFEKIKKKTVDSSEWPKVTKAAGKLSQAPLYIDDTPGASFSELSDKIYHLKNDHDVQLIILDCLEPACDGGRTKQFGKGSNIFYAFKALACKLNIPLIAVIQLPRRGETHRTYYYRLSDLQSLGINESDADLIIFLSKENEDSSDEGNVRLNIVKNLSGPVSSVKLRLLEGYCRIEEV